MPSAAQATSPGGVRPSLEPVAAGVPAQLPPAAVARLVARLLGEGNRVSLPVRGSSMAPFLKAGDVVTLEPAACARFGDVVARLAGAERLLVHRALGRRRGRLLTRGDAAAAPDPPTAPGELLGRVCRVERAGASARLGLGPERIALALLSRLGWLRPLLVGLLRVRRALLGTA